MTIWKLTRRLILIPLGLSNLAQAEIIFTDVTEQVGLGLTEIATHAVAWADYDDDGDMDVYLPNLGGNKLFRNDGGGVFTDVTSLAGVAGPDTVAGTSIGVSFGDLDNDGDLDLFVSQVNEDNDQLFRNDGYSAAAGTVVFTDITLQAGITEPRTARGMTMVDYNRDGLLDLYVLGSGGSLMYKNLGNLQFEDVATEIGVATVGLDVGVVVVDIDNNGWPDLFVGNRSDDPTNLFINQDGVFTDIAQSSGIAASGLGMGVVALDYDNDLDFDLYWTTWPGEVPPLVSNRFYRNDGDLNFSDVTVFTGTSDTRGWGISANTGDLENDGYMDMFVTNGFDASSTPSVLYHNNGAGQFEELTSLLENMPKDTRSVSFSDYDNDGDEDLMITAVAGESNRLYRNDTTDGNHWLKVNLIATEASGFGARVEVTTDVRTTVRELRAATARSNQDSLELIFGLGQAAEIQGIKVYWPSGQTQMIETAEMDQTLAIREPGSHFHQYSGSWYGGPEEDFHGFNIEELDNNRVLAYWYTFDEDGNQYWVQMDGRRSLNRVSGPAFTAEGGLDPDNVEIIEWGALEFVFDNCDQGTVSWEPTLEGFSAGTSPLQRLSNPAVIECKE